MALTNNNKQQVDLPVWEWMRFAPASSSALTALTTARDGVLRYIYYFYGSTLYRYDTVGDTWQQLSIGLSPVTALSVQYVKNQGFNGNVLQVPSTTTLRIPSVNTNMLNGCKIKIVSGTGIGQSKTIVSTSPEYVHEQGLVTTVTTSVITDTVRRWKQNEWVGYTLKLIYNTGFSQFREILYNDQTTATIYDANYEGRNFLSTPFNSGAPYASPNATAGSQVHFTIASQIITVDSEWDTPLDTTSIFEVESGGIWWMSANASSPYFNFYFYDVITDRWVAKLTPTGLISAALATDWSIVPLSDSLLGNLIESGVTSATSKTLTDTTLNLIDGQYINFHIKIISGLGIGQERRIISNTNNKFIIGAKWTIIPNNTSRYTITTRDNLFVIGNSRSQMIRYSPYHNVWSTSNIVDSGIANNLVLTRSDKLQFGVSTATIASNGIRIVNPTPVAAGINYQVGDILTVPTGAGGRVRVESINPLTGAILTLSLYSCGSGYGNGTSGALTGGSGSGSPTATLTVGNVGVITTSIINDVKIGDSVTFMGANPATTAWNSGYTILGVQSQTILEVLTTATISAVAYFSLGTNFLQDLTKNWNVNEFAGKLLGVQSNGISGTITWRKIIGNSTNTISFIVGTAPTNGNSRYYIQELDAFGKDVQFLPNNQLSYGYATSGSTQLLIDSTKSWLPSWYNGNKIRMISEDGIEVEDFVSSNYSSGMTLGRYVAVGAGTNSISYSYDGVTWVAGGASIFTTSGRYVCWNGTIFVAVGEGTNTIAYSYDGVTWTGVGVTIFSTTGYDVCWNGTMFVAVGVGTNTIAYSFNGINWVGIGTTILTTAGYGVCWNGTMFVAVGTGTNSIAYSYDGLNWVGVTGTATFGAGGYGVCWNGTKFVAVGKTTNSIAYSSNGIVWSGSTSSTTIFSVQGNSVTWNGTRFVAVGEGTNSVAYSTDGISWTGGGLGATVFTTRGNDVCWDGSKFTAVGQGGRVIISSPDGITWTANTSTVFTTAGYGVCSTSHFVSITPNIGIIPNTLTKYEIQDTFGTAIGTQSGTQLQDLTKKWKVNQWVGKRLYFSSGTGTPQELTITSNTVNALIFGNSTAPDTTTTYTIIGRPQVGAGIQLLWNFGTTDTFNKGRFLISPRGGNTHTIDTYDITTNRWRYGDFIYGHGELLTTGTMYSYDGVDKIYYQVNAIGKILYYDIVKNEISTLGTIPYSMGTAIVSNRMEIIQTIDGLKYLYIMRHSAQEMWRMLIF